MMSSLIHSPHTAPVRPDVPHQNQVLMLIPDNFILSCKMQRNFKYTIILVCSSDGFGQLAVAGLLGVEKLFSKH